MAVMTISRGVMAGGEALAKRLAERLGYKAINREVIIGCSKKYNIIEQDLLDELENVPSLWHRLTRERNRDLIYIKCSLLDAVKADNIIYYGPAGPLLLSELINIFHLRLEADLEDRVSRAIKELSKDRGEALEYIQEHDNQRRRWVKLLYDEDLRNPELYDLTVNMQDMSLDAICDMMAETITLDNYLTTADSIRKLNDVSLACEVKAAIASDDRIWSQPISVRASNGVVSIRGTVEKMTLKDLIMETALQVKGVINCNMQVGLSTMSVPEGHD